MFVQQHTVETETACFTAHISMVIYCWIKMDYDVRHNIIIPLYKKCPFQQCEARQRHTPGASFNVNSTMSFDGMWIESVRIPECMTWYTTKMNITNFRMHDAARARLPTNSALRECVNSIDKLIIILHLICTQWVIMLVTVWEPIQWQHFPHIAYSVPLPA